MTQKRVLIISASAGTGHVRAGEALAKAFQADSRTAEVVHEDALKYTNKLFRDFYSTLYTKLVKNAADAPSAIFYRTSGRAVEERGGAAAIRPAEHTAAGEIHPEI